MAIWSTMLHQLPVATMKARTTMEGIHKVQWIRTYGLERSENVLGAAWASCVGDTLFLGCAIKLLHGLQALHLPIKQSMTKYERRHEDPLLVTGVMTYIFMGK